MDNSMDLLFAVFNGEQEISDEMFDEVKRFAAYVAQRKKQDDKA